jgi:hypothetical protein
MAKRPTARTESGDTPNPKPRTRRARASQPAPDQAQEQAIAAIPAAGPTEELPRIPEPGDAADRASSSMGSEPSEEDIRLRAYHRFLERGGRHGEHFNDWLQAEEDLKWRGRSGKDRSPSGS